MSTYHEFEERLAAYFALELRRQGIPDVEEWLDRLRTYSAYIPTVTATTTPSPAAEAAAATLYSDAGSSTASSSTRRKSNSTSTLVMDMTGLTLGDRVAVALCESLLKVDAPNLRQRSAAVAEWQLLWRDCKLTDRSLRHLELLVTGCAKLTVVDVAGNAFSEAGRTGLLNAAAEVPCDVIVQDGHAHYEDADTKQKEKATAESSGAEEKGDASTRPRSQPHHHIDAPSTSPTIRPSSPLEWKSERAVGASTSLQTHASATALPVTLPVTDTLGFFHPPDRVQLRGNASAATAGPSLSSSSQRRLQRSPSLSATSTSLSRSQRVYASGSAEALQRRRDELFGSSAPTTPAATAAAEAISTTLGSPFLSAATPPTPTPASPQLTATAAAATANADQFPDVVSASGQQGRGETRPASATVVREESSSEKQQMDASPLPMASSASRGSHSPFRAIVTAPNSPSEESERLFSFNRRGGGIHGGATPVQQQLHSHNNNNNNKMNKNRNDAAAAAVTSERPLGAASREPFVDRNDHLDVTANLSPMLDSVLDLSALTTREGTLRQAHMFGGAETVWDVLLAYEQAAEQQQQQQQGSCDILGVDETLRARLPVALLGGTTYSAITVLNLSRNHLTTLCAMPPTLLRLDVSSNDLTELTGLHTCTMLTVLNARRNRLCGIGGLEKNLGIAHLFLGHNDLSMVEGLAHLVLLETLDLTFNQLRTQTSLRMLSLCSALRHLLLRGNPVVEKAKPGFLAVLRNLCPTLLVIDEQRVGSARLAERALQQRGWGPQPNMIGDASSTGARSPAKAIAGGGGEETIHPLVAAPAPSYASTSGVGNTQLRGDGASSSLSTTSSLPFTSSRHRRGDGKAAPFSTEASDVDNGGSLRLLRLLTRGVTAPTGYGDSTRSQHIAHQLATRQKVEAERAKATKERQLTANGRNLRGAVVQQLAEESRRYLEDTMVRRMTAQQQGTASPFNEKGMSSNVLAATTPTVVEQQRSSLERNSQPTTLKDVAGGVVSPARARSPQSHADAVDPATASVLRRYALRTKPIKRHAGTGPSSLGSRAPPQPRVATTHAAELRAASARRAGSVGSTSAPGILNATPSRQQSPSTTSLPPRSTSSRREPSAAAHCGPGGARAQSAPQSSTTPTNTNTNNNISNNNEMDATLDAMYVENAQGKVWGPADAAAKSTYRNAKSSGGDAAGSYAALHLADTHAAHQRAVETEDAEVECSPIAKDPQARLVASLNTTASMYERSDLREVAPAVPHRPSPSSIRTAAPRSQPPQQPPKQQQQQRDHVHGAPPTPAYAAAPQPSGKAASTATATAAAAAPQSRSSSSPTTATLSRTNTNTRGSGRLHYDPAKVEETAIYPSSRSHSRGSHTGVTRGAAPALVEARQNTRAATPSSTAALPSSSASSSTRRRRPSALCERDERACGGDDGAVRATGHMARSTSSSSRSRSSPMQPLHIDAAQRRRVLSWTAQLSEDAAAVQEALQALVELLEAQRQPGLPYPESSRELPPTYVHERRRCVEIIHESGMLADTQVPMEVVVYYGFGKAELDGEVEDSRTVVAREGKSESAWQREVAERAEVLRVVHLLGDAKTCLRYVALLIGDGREKLLQQYVDQLKESLRS